MSEFGLPSDQNYFSAKDFSPEEIALALEEKLSAEYSRNRPTADESRSVAVLTLEARTALGLVVTAPVPMSRHDLGSLFPEVNWVKHVRKFRRNGLVIERETLIAPAKYIRGAFVEEIPDLKTRWADRLAELSEYPDCAFFLSLHYLSEQRFDDSVLTLANVAIVMEPSWWVGPYTSIFENLNIPRIWRKLKPETRIAFHHAYGRCLVNSGRYSDGRSQFEKMKRAAKRFNDDHSLGLAFLSIGVSYHKERRLPAAGKWYQRAREHGEKHGYAMVASHAMGNLAQIQAEQDPGTGIALLEQSIEYKKRCNDQEGIAVALLSLAVVYAEIGQFEKAIEYYERAETIAVNLDLRHLRALLLNNKAQTLLQSGEATKALRIFKKALKIADVEGFSELKVRSTSGICQIYFEKGRLDAAEASMLESVDLAKAAGAPEFEMMALHGLWAVYSLKGDLKAATHSYARLTRTARRLRSYDWLVRAIVDKSKVNERGEFRAPDPKILRQLIRAESRRDDAMAMGLLWYALAQILGLQDVGKAVDALMRSIDFLSRETETVLDLLSSYQYLHELQWDSGKIHEAIETLDVIAKLAKEHRYNTAQIAAIEQKGFCLQSLGEHEAAMPFHVRAANRARQLELTDQVVTSLHNLAECKRRLGKPAAAVKILDEARIVAEAHKDVEAIVQIDHGRALAHEDLKDYDTALSLFRKCRRRSLNNGFWVEYVRACEAIANLSWIRGRRKTAVRQYEKALAACDEHDVQDGKPRIGLNLSRLLRLLGRITEAQRLLAKQADLVIDPFRKSEFHSTLAELCEDTGRVEDARKHWRIAVESANAIGNKDESTYCRLRLAEFERKQTRFDLSEEELEALLKEKLSAEHRAIALKQLFELLLECDSEARASKAFRLAEQHMRKHDLNAHLIDIHMYVFDHNWKGDRESRLDSLQAYAGAFTVAAEDPDGEELISEIISFVNRKLTDSQTAPPIQQLKWLIKHFEGWLIDQQGCSSELVKFLSLPLRWAERLIPCNGDPEKMLEEHKRFFG